MHRYGGLDDKDLVDTGPSRTQRADFPHWAPQMTLTMFIASNRRMQVASKRQLEPQAIARANLFAI
jgi:hypothetical protein